MTDRYDPNDPLAGVPSYQDIEQQGADPLPPMQPAPQPSEPQRAPLLTGLVLGLLLVVVSIALFGLLSDDAPPEASVTTTTLDPNGDSTAAPDDSVASNDDPAATADGIVAEPYVAIGDPFTIAELPLAVDGIGDLDFGIPAAQAVGRLISSLGDPDSDTGPVVADGTWGTCVGDTERIVTWGPLAAVIVVDPDGSETFAAYRLDLALRGFSHPAADLATLSGFQVGRSFRQLEQTYADFVVRKSDDPDIGTTWELESTNTGNVLLYGPLTTEDTVRGIYSLDACGRF